MKAAETLAGLNQVIEEGLEHQSQAAILDACTEIIGLQAKVDALAAVIFSKAKDYHVHEAAGHRSLGLALANQTQLGVSKCSRLVNRASVLVRLLPEVLTAYQDGKLNSSSLHSI